MQVNKEELMPQNLSIKGEATLSKKNYKDERNQINIVKQWLKENYEIHYNEVSNRNEFRKLNDKDSTFRDLTDSKVNSIMFEMLELGIEISYYRFRTLLHSDFIKTTNPFEDYLDALLPWDKRDYIRMLASRIETTNNELWNLYLKRWLVGVVACAYNKDIMNESVLIFLGAQNIGKSRFFRRLRPKMLEKYYHEGRLNFKDKNSLFLLSESWIINLDEFENILVGSVEEFKSVLSTGCRRLRRPYAALSEEFPRRASFAATINTPVFLKDPTGNRRFLVVEAKKIDSSEIDYLDGVYSQAFHLWRNGEPHYFNEVETKLINEHNHQFELVQPEFEVIKQFLRPKSEADEIFKSVTATEIARYLCEKTKLQMSTRTIQKMGIALRSLGFISRKSNGNQIYDVIENS